MPPTTRARALLVALVATLALGGLAACGDDNDEGGSSATTTAPGGISVTDVWARESAAAAGNGAVYFTITNTGTAGDELLSASVSTEVAMEAQVHETTMATDTTMDGMPAMTGSTMGEGPNTSMAGMMSMQEVESVPVPAGETVNFEPGGYHVMLMGLTEPLEVGSSFPVTLTFAEAGEIDVVAEVRAS